MLVQKIFSYLIFFYSLILFQKNSNLTIGQKITEMIMVFPMFLILGYECNLVERALEIASQIELSKAFLSVLKQKFVFQHNAMYESLVQASVMTKKSSESYFLKMLILRSQKNIKMTDYGFFNMGMHGFKKVSI